MIIKRNYRRASAILTSDWHAIELGNNPPCRIDDYMTTFTDKMNQISSLQEKHDCPILNAGDIFDHWKPSPELINHCCMTFPKKIHSVAGNHDLPQHSMDLFDKSGYASLNYAGVINHLPNQISWNDDISLWADEGDFCIENRRIAIAHLLVWKNEKPFPGSKSPRVDEVFDMFPEADLILTGDNHKTFTARQGDRLLINPGSLMRRRGDQLNHNPCVFLWFSDTNTYKIHYLKINKKSVSRRHLDDEKNLKNNKELFLGKLDDEFRVYASFKDTIQGEVKANNIPKSIRKYILRWTKL